MSKTNNESVPLSSTGWHYPPTGRRDLRIDFLRGLAMIIMVIAHIEVFSVFNLFTSERFGLVSGAEGFVIFAGIVLGSLYRYRLPLDGWITSIYRIWSRVWKLYLVSLFIIISIYLLALIPFINAHEVTTFTNRGADIVYPLYPVETVSLNTALNFLFYLQAGPHQTQVLGLYIVLMLLTPLILAAFHKKKATYVLVISWLLYFYYQKHHINLTKGNFENAFAILAWQAIFYTSLAIGWYKTEITSYMHGMTKKLLLGFCISVSLVLFFVAQNHTNMFLPSWAHLNLIPAQTFNWVYSNYALKTTLGPLRVLNDFCLLVTLYWLLTICWTPFYKALGWYLIPVGQASLYVFIVHVYVVLLVSQFVSFDLHPNNWFINTCIHGGALFLLWWMTKKQIGMRFIHT
jgi:hypothetical protein